MSAGDGALSSADQAMKASLEKLKKDNDAYCNTQNARNESVLADSMGDCASALQRAGRREKAEQMEASRRKFMTSGSRKKRQICRGLSKTLVRICDPRTTYINM